MSSDLRFHLHLSFLQSIALLLSLNYFHIALRFYPPVPINARVANKATTLPVGGGLDGESPVYIHKGQKVVFSSFATHRSTLIWGEDALVFRPERWENGEAVKEGGGTFFPFLMGPRACPGREYILNFLPWIQRTQRGKKWKAS